MRTQHEKERCDCGLSPQRGAFCPGSGAVVRHAFGTMKHLRGVSSVLGLALWMSACGSSEEPTNSHPGTGGSGAATNAGGTGATGGSNATGGAGGSGATGGSGTPTGGSAGASQTGGTGGTTGG